MTEQKNNIVKIRTSNFDRCIAELIDYEVRGELLDVVLCYRHKVEGEAPGLRFYFSSEEETSSYLLGLTSRLEHVINEYMDAECEVIEEY